MIKNTRNQGDYDHFLAPGTFPNDKTGAFLNFKRNVLKNKIIACRHDEAFEKN